MSADGCARASSDLTVLVHRLDLARRALIRQSRMPEDDFGGLSGDAYRRHAARSAVTVAGVASDLALLAGALAALGRALAAAEDLRRLAAGSPPQRARELRLRARGVEQRGQQRWWTAVAAYEGRDSAAPRPAGRPTPPPPMPPEPVTPAPPAAAAPTTTAPTLPTAPAVAAVPPPEPVLESELVMPPPKLESDLVVPPDEPARCGTSEAIDERR